jgi:hypothetical protein
MLLATQRLKLRKSFGRSFGFGQDRLPVRKDLITPDHERIRVFGGDALRFHFRQRVSDITGRGILCLKRCADGVFIDPRDNDVKGEARVLKQLGANF